MSSRRSLLILGLPNQILSALTRHDYTSLEDLANITPQTLEKGKRLTYKTGAYSNNTAELGIPIDIGQDLINRSQNASTLAPALMMTQPAARLVENMAKFSTKCPALDKILGDGLSRGHILEVSGPPGSPKETIGINILASSIEEGNEVIFIGKDCAPTFGSL